jgi:hypothetical protein
VGAVYGKGGDGGIEDRSGRFGDAPCARRVAMLMLMWSKMQVKVAMGVGKLKLKRGGEVRIGLVLETAHTVARKVC